MLAFSSGIREKSTILTADTLCLRKGDKVLVVTEEGPAVGCVCTEPQCGPEDHSDRKLKKVFRVATREEIDRYERDCRT